MGERSSSRRERLSPERLALVSRYLGEEPGSSGSLVDDSVAELQALREPPVGAATGTGPTLTAIPLEPWDESSFAFSTLWTRLTGQNRGHFGTKARWPLAAGTVAVLLGYLAGHL
jgi:hypothetical protein